MVATKSPDQYVDQVKSSHYLGPWRALLRAHAAVIDKLTAEMKDEIGLPIGWYEVLLFLEEAPTGRLRMHELADSLVLSRSAVTRFADRMEAADLVTRITYDADRRGFELAMTDEGRSVFRRAGRIHLRGIAEHFAAHIEPAEAAAIESAMTRVLLAASSDAASQTAAEAAAAAEAL